MTLHQATAEHLDSLRKLDRISTEHEQASAVAEAREQGVIDYWQTMPRPYAVVVSAEPNRSSPGYYVVTIQCPYCGSDHSHGWAGPGTTGGHRAAHCADPTARHIAQRGYVLTIPADLEVTR